MKLPSDLLATAARLSTATLHEAAGRIGSLPSRIKPVHGSWRLCAPAYPVRSPGGDNLWIHRAIYAAPPGSVLVVDVGGATEHGYWGEIMSEAATARGLAGLVIDGGVRDSATLVTLGFPVFASGVCIRGTGKDPNGDGSVGVPITVGTVTIELGDLVLGDADGVVVVPASKAAAGVSRSVERDASEALIIERLRAGETTMDIYSLPSGPAPDSGQGPT